MEYDLIVSDVDGCLTPEESAGWDHRMFAALVSRVRGERAPDQDDGRDRGGAIRPAGRLPLTLCTGRPQPYVEALLKILDIDLPAVCENGAVIYRLSTNESVYGPGVTPDGLREIGEVRQHIVMDLLPSFPGATLQFGKQAQVSVFSADPAQIPPLAERVRQFAARFADDPFVIGASHYYLNVSLAGVDKGSAIEQVMRELAVDRSRTAAIGDTEGDLPLREHAAFFACPANATPPIKAKADYVSPYRDMEAMVDILDRITGSSAGASGPPGVRSTPRR